MRARIRREDGLSILELTVVGMMLAIVSASAAAVVVSAQRTARFAEQEQNALNAGTLALRRMQRDIRGALSFTTTCPGITDCLRLQAQLGDGAVHRVQYRVSGTTVYRELGCTVDFSTCDGSAALVTNRLATSGQVFTCRAPQSHTAHVEVFLQLSPLATVTSSGNLEFRTRARPRNVSAASC